MLISTISLDGCSRVPGVAAHREGVVNGREGGVACHRKGLVSGLKGVVGMSQWVLGICQGVFMDWEAIDGDNSFQGVFLADSSIKASIKGTLGVTNI